MSVPLILTLILEEEPSAYFTSLRDEYFPVEKNFLKAHLTLFHHLPDIKIIDEDLSNYTLEQNTFMLETSGLMFLGMGFAVKMQSAELENLHASLQKKWWMYLTNQDRQKLRPHITIQNKVSPEQARVCMNEFLDRFEDRKVPSTGLALWEYLGGPWKLKKEYPWKDWK
ncbi:2'-5' RNA ligase family protein [Desertivirga arenae]|uniref:2'-5' RNA ligase family protein n=1 Tax=Desertivirga arenae TaxID=2810309 RepID=UPI001A95E572|nr:2'-5' RNA ligase family protein [Pedobacter sp. SYSU D00823]